MTKQLLHMLFMTICCWTHYHSWFNDFNVFSFFWFRKSCFVSIALNIHLHDICYDVLKEEDILLISSITISVLQYKRNDNTCTTSCESALFFCDKKWYYCHMILVITHRSSFSSKVALCLTEWYLCIQDICEYKIACIVHKLKWKLHFQK